ncbi:hypothetical protein IT570_09275 [Candidatus Sumerlaeota bacterium]|nr:hypothetical protein [Candidatus Sumerlaeota bacterium]
MKRLTRGWRWRAFFMIAAAGSYWFARMAGFGPGATVWFPGGVRGVEGFTVFLGVAGVILGADCVGQWDRYRARQSLETRVTNPLRFVLANVLAVTLTGVFPATLICFWSVVGAWYSDFYVLWTPNLVYLVAGAVPLLFCGATTGLFGRALFKADLAAMATGVLLLGPVLIFRVLSAPVQEVFQLASESFGILVPVPVLVREASMCLAYGALWMVPAAVLLPYPRPRTPAPGGRFVRFDLPLLREIAARGAQQLRQLSKPLLMILGCLALIGGMATAEMMRLLPLPRKAVDWERITDAEGARNGVLRELRVVKREIGLPTKAGDPIQISLDVTPISGETATGLVSFGSTLEVKKTDGVGGIRVEEVTPRLGTRTPLHLLRFTPPLTPGSVARASFTLEPTPLGRRLWERAYDKRFHQFSGLGDWYGVSASLNFNNSTALMVSNESPFEVVAPPAGDLDWRAGAAQVTKLADGRVRITQPLADTPSRLIAARMMEFPPTEADVLPVTFVLQPQRRKLGAELHKIFSTPFQHLHRLFGEPPEKLYVYEVPENEPADALAIPSSTLEVLEALLPDFNDYERPTSAQFYDAFKPNHEGLVRAVFTKSFSGIDDADLMSSAMLTYLNDYGLNHGLREAYDGRTRKDEILRAWPNVQGGGMPFDVRRGMSGEWKGAAIGAESHERRKPVIPLRLVAFHHTLRGQIGDDAFVQGIRALTQDHRGEVLTVDLYRKVMEEAHGDSLEWLFDEWLREGVLPRYEIPQAEALLIENSDTRALEYTTKVTIRNSGTGRMEVPWLLMTEEQSVRGREWLGAGENKELLIKSLDRPVAFEIDPDGWIPQLTATESRDGTDHARVFFKTVREL